MINKDEKSPFKTAGEKLPKDGLNYNTDESKPYPGLVSAKVFFFFLSIFFLILSASLGGKIRDLNGEESKLRSACVTERENLLTLSKILSYYKEKNGSYPSNDEQLTQIPLFKEIAKSRPGHYTLDAKFKTDLPAVHKTFDEIINASAGYNYRECISISDSVVLSPYSVPYILENRSGQPEEKFKNSPLNDKIPAREKYSVEVDKGIFIYSPAILYHAHAQANHADKIKAFSLFKTLSQIAGAILAILFLSSFNFSTVKVFIISSIEAIIGLAAIGVAFLIATQNYTSCYRPSSFDLPPRNPNTLNLCSEILEKYKQNGIINESSYQKFKNALTKELTKF